MWGAIFVNYPEWINEILVINTPTFFSVLWKAFSPFLPENTRNKIKMMNSDWKTEILKYIAPECLPVHWGGKMVDENGDPMCRTKIVVPQGKIPESFYWRNAGKYKELPDDEVKSKTIGAGSIVFSSFYTIEPNTILRYYLSTPDDFTFQILFTEDPKETDLGKMDEIFPQIEIPGGLAPDNWFFVCEKPGVYHIKFGNEKAWFLSVTFKYRLVFEKQDGSKTEVVALNGTEL